MKRFHQETALMRKRRGLALRVLGMEKEAAAPGRFRKRHPLDCGRPRCQLCHGEKVSGKRSHKERQADQSFAFELSLVKTPNS